VVGDLGDALDSAGVEAAAEDAPWVLTLPARLLTAVAGNKVRKLRPDRLIELRGPSLRVGVYPSDIAISGPVRERTRARAAILSRLATTAAHQTTSSEAQAVEDEILKVAESGRASAGRARAQRQGSVRRDRFETAGARRPNRRVGHPLPPPSAG